MVQTAFSMPFSYLQHLLILGGWPQNTRYKIYKIKRNPGATRTRDGNEERLARARETEREKAMVFLDVLVNYGCRRWLHKEDYSFE